MKKLLICTLFSLALVLLFSSTVSADVIPPNSHSLDRCVKIVNLNDFSDVVLIGYVTGPMVQGSEINQIKNNECLSKGYKFNSLKIYWNTKDKPNSIDQNNLLLDNVDVYGGYIDQGNPLIKETIEYSIAGYSNGKLILYKSKHTSEYNNGTTKKVETFQPNVTPSPEPIKRGFWQSIICFFRGLFGRGCQ